MKTLWFVLALFLIPCVAGSADLTTSTVVGKIIQDAEVMDATFYKTSTIGIPTKILQGRAIVDAHRQRKDLSYDVTMTRQDRVATNLDRLFWLREKLKALGFENEYALRKQSNAADLKAGLKEGSKGWWR